MNQCFRSGAQVKPVDVPAGSQAGTNNLNSLFPISWATVKKKGSGYSDGSLTNRLHIYKGFLGMTDFKSIKAPKYFGSSGDDSLHIC